MKRKTATSRSAPRADAASPAEPSGLVSAGESSAGFLGYDDLGQPKWTWMTELDPGLDPADADDVLSALDSGLSLADEPGGQETGYDPYDTARIKVGDRFRRR